MSHVLPALAATAALALTATPARAQEPATHTTVDPASIVWKPGPAAVPPGAKSAVLYGDPAKEGLFVMRLWVPKGYTIPPHTHPRPEILTVVSGTFNLAMGSTADRSKAHRLPAGSFSAMQPNTPHFAFADEETVLQISTTGPWAIAYLNPADDPRNRK